MTNDSSSYDSTASVSIFVGRGGVMAACPMQPNGRSRAISRVAPGCERAEKLNEAQILKIMNSSAKFYSEMPTPEESMDGYVAAMETLLDLFSLNSTSAFNKDVWAGVIDWEATGDIRVIADIRRPSGRNERQEWRSLPGDASLTQVLEALRDVMLVAVRENAKVGYDVPPDLTIS